jgi:cation diffusion facilitator family transporter
MIPDSGGLPAMFGRRRAGHNNNESSTVGEAQSRSDSHGHGAIDRVLLSSERGIWATKISLAALLATACIQIVIFVLTGSVALLADTIHNFGDAATALPLWAAFTLARRRPTPRFPYGYGRAEDLAGVAIVLAILATGALAGYESARRLTDPPEIQFVWAVVAASIIGFFGNEAVALFRIRIGKEIGSAALVADGNHARVDGLTSLAVLFGAIGVYLGYPLADPIVGLAITLAILRIVWQSGKSVLSRLLDGVEPGVVEEVRRASWEVEGVEDVTEVRVRWLGHQLLAEVNIAVNRSLSVGKAHSIAQEVNHELLHHLQYLSNATIHVDPLGLSGEEHHRQHTDHQEGDETDRGPH